MDAVEYLKTLCRMCNCECLKCEFGKARSGFETCPVWQRTHPEEADKCKGIPCPECRRKFWLAEVEDV